MSEEEPAKHGPGDRGGKESAESPEAAKNEPGHGRLAVRPYQFPLRGWRDILLRTKRAVKKDHLPMIAAGVAFFMLLGSVPALVALISIYGLFADPADVRSHLAGAERVMPADAYEIVAEQLEGVTAPDGGAGIGAIVGILLALWAGSRGTKGLIRAVNIAYNEPNPRNWLKMQLVSLVLTLTLITLGILAVTLVAGIPILVGLLPLATVEEAIVKWTRWPLLLFLGMFALAIVYRHAPARRSPQWKWVTTGSAVAAVLWLAASAGFSFYVSKFGEFNETYGSLGAVVVLLLWLYLTAFLILVGAEINAEMEHQTRKDTTRGKPRPMGERGAYVADHLGDSQ